MLLIDLKYGRGGSVFLHTHIFIYVYTVPMCPRAYLSAKNVIFEETFLHFCLHSSIVLSSVLKIYYFSCECVYVY